MKRSGFKRKAPGFRVAKGIGWSRGPLTRRTKLRVVGHSEISETKRRIQDLLLAVVKRRDGGCILRLLPWHTCNGFANDGHLILQADHLITRGNAATYADSRLVVCVCMGAHGWKSVGGNLRKAQYDAIVKTLLPSDRVALWEACEADSWRPHRTSAMDWKLQEVALQKELADVSK
jgi:hypothetical protein